MGPSCARTDYLCHAAFRRADSFDVSFLTLWEVGNVTNMANMFSGVQYEQLCGSEWVNSEAAVIAGIGVSEEVCCDSSELLPNAGGLGGCSMVLVSGNSCTNSGRSGYECTPSSCCDGNLMLGVCEGIEAEVPA